jgi:hypothetical protein
VYFELESQSFVHNIFFDCVPIDSSRYFPLSAELECLCGGGSIDYALLMVGVSFKFFALKVVFISLVKLFGDGEGRGVEIAKKAIWFVLGVEVDLFLVEFHGESKQCYIYYISFCNN